MKTISLSGRVAVVTGGAQHLGFDMADALAEAGCDIILTSRIPERARAAADKLQNRWGVEAMVLPLDQRDHAAVRNCALGAQRWKGRIDILVNNAGGSGTGDGDFFKRDPNELREVITLSLTGVLFCCQEFGRLMAERKQGKIINIASISGIVGRNREIYRRHGKREQPVEYAAAKAGLIGLTRDLAAYLAPYDIQVNAISPGAFDRGQVPAGWMTDYAAMTPARRMGELGRDIKGVALFLASSESDYITGQNIAVDGGFTAVK